MVVAAFVPSCTAQVQVPDPEADPSVAEPAYSMGAGARVVIDTAHANFHTAAGRFGPFAALLRNDGHVVADGSSRMVQDPDPPVDILVIANAYPMNMGDAFDGMEVDAIKRYVEGGGSLLLIADHTPFPQAVMGLASAFGIRFRDVYADDGGSGIFRKGDGLKVDPLTEGIDQVRSFVGSAFSITEVPFRPLLQMGEDWTQQTMGADGLSGKTPAEGLLQGALLTVGQGRVAVFGEAAMFTAQRLGKQRFGYHAKGAGQNKEFILRVIRWLRG